MLTRHGNWRDVMCLQELMPVNFGRVDAVQGGSVLSWSIAMSEPSIFLGVPLMDRDHAVLEELLARVANTRDDGLPALLAEIEAETRAHFAREEALMREQAVPVLSCHMVQHEMLLGHFKGAHSAVARNDNGELRNFLADILPALMTRHMNTADRVTASLLSTAAYVEA